MFEAGLEVRVEHYKGLSLVGSLEFWSFQCALLQ